MSIIDFIKKYWLAVIITIAVIIIILAFFRPSPNLELKKQFEKERDDIQAELDRSRAREKLLRLDSISIRKRMQERADSVSNLLGEKDKNIKYYKKLNREIDFSKFTNAELDSVRRAVLKRYFALRRDSV